MRYPTSPLTPPSPEFPSSSPRLAAADRFDGHFPPGIFYTTGRPGSPPSNNADAAEADEGKAVCRSGQRRLIPLGLLDDDPLAPWTNGACWPVPEQHRPTAAPPPPSPSPFRRAYSQPGPQPQQLQPARSRQPSHQDQDQHQHQPTYHTPPPFARPHSRPASWQTGLPPSHPLGPAWAPFVSSINGRLGPHQPNHNAPLVARPLFYLPPQPQVPYIQVGRSLPWPPVSVPQSYRSNNNSDLPPSVNPSASPPTPTKTAPLVRLCSASPPILHVQQPPSAVAPIPPPALRSPLHTATSPPAECTVRGKPPLQPIAVGVAQRVATTARSSVFLRECQRLARDFVACAEVVQIESVEDHAAALEMLVALGGIHGAVLQKLALGDFKGLQDVLPLPTPALTETPVDPSPLPKSDSASSLSLPSLSTSSSASHLDSFAFTSPARCTDSAALAAPFSGANGPVVKRWVSRRAGQGLSEAPPTSAADLEAFYRLLLNRTTPLSIVKDAQLLSDFIVRALADPTGSKRLPLERFVKTAFEHATAPLTAGQSAARTASRSAATLLVVVHQTAVKRGKPTAVSATLLFAIQPSLTCLADKVFPPLAGQANARPSSHWNVHSRQVDGRLPSLAIFLCHLYALDATLVSSTILLELLHLLLHTPEPTQAEYFAACEVFELAGRRLMHEDDAGRADVKAAAERMKVLAGNGKLSTRTRFALQDMVDLYAHNWKTRAWMRHLRGRTEC